jgi:hypothetical protein
VQLIGAKLEGKTPKAKPSQPMAEADRELVAE